MVPWVEEKAVAVFRGWLGTATVVHGWLVAATPLRVSSPPPRPPPSSSPSWIDEVGTVSPPPPNTYQPQQNCNSHSSHCWPLAANSTGQYRCWRSQHLNIVVGPAATADFLFLVHLYKHSSVFVKFIFLMSENWQLSLFNIFLGYAAGQRRLSLLWYFYKAISHFSICFKKK